MANLRLCAQLSDAFGPSGFEHEVCKAIKSELNSFLTETDGIKNFYAQTQSDEDKPLIMLDAHTDEIGFMVQSITDKGLLKVVPLGGWVAHNVPAHSFLIKNKYGEFIKAVSTSKPVHFMSSAEQKASITMDDIMLDAGVCCKNDVVELLGIEPGCPVCPDVQFEYNDVTDMMIGKAFDCRLGCEAVVEIMQRMYAQPLAVNLAASFTSQEEVGLRGAAVAARKLKPALAICLEGTPADDMFTAESEIQGGLKRGVQLRHRDGSMIACPEFVAFARKVAEDNGIVHQCAVRTGGGTNAGNIHLSENGIPTIVLGVPVRYAHSHYCYSTMQDLDSAIDLACAIIRELTPEIIDSIINTI